MIYFADEPLLLKGVEDTVGGVLSFLFLFLPLAMIPFAFKIAGGLIGRLNDVISGYKTKTAETIKGNPNDPRSLRNRTRYRMGAALDQARGAARNAAANASKVGGEGGKKRRARRWIMRQVARGLDYGDLEGRLAERNKASKELVGAQYGMGPDSSIRAFWAERVTGADGVSRWLSPYEQFDEKTQTFRRKEWSQADVDRANTRAMRDPSLIQAFAEYEFGKAGSDKNLAAFKTAYARKANELRLSEGDAGGAWTGVAFAQQGIRKEQKFSTLTRGDDGRLGFQDKRESKFVPGMQLRYGSVNQYDFSNEMVDAVRKWDVASMRSSTAEAAKEGFEEHSRIVQDLSSRQGSLSPQEAAQLQASQGVVRNWTEMAQNLSSSFNAGRGFDPHAFADEDAGGGPGVGAPGLGASVRAENAWKDFTKTILGPGAVGGNGGSASPGGRP